MANYQYSGDLVDDILFRCGEPTDGTSDFNARALQCLNRAYEALYSGGAELDPHINEVWWWSRKSTPGVLTLSPAKVAGNADVTNNSTTITFSSAPTESVANWHFRIDDRQDIFRISTHTASATSATLDSVYTHPTATGKSYHLMKLEYALATDVLSIVSPMRAYRDGKVRIDGISQEEMDDQWPIAYVDSGTPKVFCPITESRIRFSHYGSTVTGEFQRVDYDYLYIPAALTDSGTEEPIVPIQYRRVLADYGAVFLMKDKNDNRAADEVKLASAGLMAMARENRRRSARMSRNFGAILPRQGDAPRMEGPVRTSAGLIIG